MKLISAALLYLLPSGAFAHDYTVGDVKIDHPVARATTETARTSAGYFRIENIGSEDDALVGVEADFPRVEMHTTEVDGDGVASMRRIMSIPLPAGEMITFERGGLHVMFVGLSEPFLEGETVPAALIFEKAGRVEIEFNIEKIDGHGHMNHDEMDHGEKEDDHSNHDH